MKELYSVFYTADMGEQLWEKLPMEMLCHILAKLPLRPLTRLRGVSKQWRSIIASPDTLALSRPLKSPLMAEPMLAVAYEGKEPLEWATYSFESNKWSIMSAFPEVVQAAASSGEKVDYYSSGGLMFFMLSSYSNYTYTRCLVYNPLTKALRELPLFSGEWVVGAFAHPVTDSEADTYKFMMGDQEHWARYTSSSDSWDEGTIHGVGCLASGTKGVQCKDLLFFVVPTMRGKSDLATYNSKTNVWLDTFDYEQMAEVGYHLNNRGYSENNRIFEWDGSLFLMTTPDGCVSELDLVTKNWTKRFEMPRNILGDFEKIQNCFAKGNRLCVVGSAKARRYTSLFVVYLKQEDRWDKLEPCPYDQSDAQSFLFQPSLLSV